MNTIAINLENAHIGRSSSNTNNNRVPSTYARLINGYWIYKALGSSAY